MTIQPLGSRLEYQRSDAIGRHKISDCPITDNVVHGAEEIH